jgi:hypothetical protein
MAMNDNVVSEAAHGCSVSVPYRHSLCYYYEQVSKHRVRKVDVHNTHYDAANASVFEKSELKDNIR